MDLYISLAGNGWVYVEGDDLEQPIEVKVATVDGRPAVTALRIDNSSEVTSRSLRAIKIPGVAKQVVAHIRGLADDLEPSEAEVEALKAYTGPLTHSWNEEASAMLAIAEAGAAAMELREWLDRLSDVDTTALEQKERGRGAPPATEDELRAFARVYLEELEQGSHGAKTRTSTRFGMNRTTVYAWIRACQEHGLLPADKPRSNKRKGR